ncbi:MAG: tRNA (adenosine(37)-N6)-dimethylallyltransferase MiaA [Eggerthellaceae bacterium]|nr:tRNA (adenosine(37)-N6)-dimethylallyltransferase MiaA [Eggerthellaceae bacterium]
MEGNSHKDVVCVVGPTASGKSSLAIRLAQTLDGEIVSADSMQVYRGMDIGTGKVPDEQRLVPHFGLDLVDPGEPYSAALFQTYARERFNDIQSRGKRPLLCGGTGFYVRAAIDDYDFAEGEQIDNPVRKRYMKIAAERGSHELWKLLDEADSDSAAVIPENDVKRVVRAFEMLEAGESYAKRKEMLSTIPQHVPAVFIGLSVDVEVLKKRIDDRVDEMVESGLVEEVKGLLDKGFREGITAPQAIGYKEIVAALDGEISLDEAIGQIKLATRRYAKRQRTWFRKDARIHWINADTLNLDYMLEEALGIVATIDGNREGEPSCATTMIS